MIEKDGGFAFPSECEEGMTLRDWFAGQALIGIMVEGSLGSNTTAETCYRFADAMLKERVKE